MFYFECGRILINEKYIASYFEEDQKQSTSSNSISNGPIVDIQSAIV
jgi:hypothetical protein